MITDEQSKAIVKAENAVKNDPANSERQVELGMAYFDAERFDDALAAFQHAIALNPGVASAYNGIGRVRYHTGPAQAAIDAYQRAIAIDRHYIDAYYGLGILYSAQLGKNEAALETFKNGLEHNPNEAFLLASLGSTYARMGRFEEAIVSLRQAITLEPDHTFSYSWLSIIFLHLKQYDETIAACQREIEIADDHSARRMLGYAYDRLGRHDESIAELERSVALERQDYEARGALARVYQTVGRQEDSREQYAIASEMAAQDNEYGQACFEAVSGHLEQALTLLEVALAKGQAQPGWVRIDPEFAFINDDSRFKALIDG
jgi:superkiller protein 3